MLKKLIITAVAVFMLSFPVSADESSPWIWFHSTARANYQYTTKDFKYDKVKNIAIIWARTEEPSSGFVATYREKIDLTNGTHQPLDPMTVIVKKTGKTQVGYLHMKEAPIVPGSPMDKLREIVIELVARKGK